MTWGSRAVALGELVTAGQCRAGRHRRRQADIYLAPTPAPWWRSAAAHAASGSLGTCPDKCLSQPLSRSWPLIGQPVATQPCVEVTTPRGDSQDCGPISSGLRREASCRLREVFTALTGTFTGPLPFSSE